jgi:monolysocardiolipin acyltransferase
MPEGRWSPYKYVPHLGSNLGVAIGSPIPSDDFKGVIKSRLGINLSTTPDRSLGEIDGWMSESKVRHLIRGKGVTLDEEIEQEIKGIRSDVTAVVHRAVEELGRKVSKKNSRR